MLPNPWLSNSLYRMLDRLKPFLIQWRNRPKQQGGGSAHAEPFFPDGPTDGTSHLGPQLANSLGQWSGPTGSSVHFFITCWPVFLSTFGPPSSATPNSRPTLLESPPPAQQVVPPNLGLRCSLRPKMFQLDYLIATAIWFGTSHHPILFLLLNPLLRHSQVHPLIH